MEREIEILLFRKGSRCPFTEWLNGMKDARNAGVVRARLNRIRLRNFGDCRSVGDGVEELRIDLGPGFRVYFARHGADIVLLLCAGAKRTQKRDIERAKRFWKEYQDAQSESGNGGV